MKHDNSSHNSAHRPLGRFLKTHRQRLQESLGETLGAVEIEVEQLDRFERGTEVPSEDILMLLISHFGLQEEEAVKAWELAGYDHRTAPSGHAVQDDEGQLRQTMHVMLLAMDSRVLYTNNVDIVTDDNGVVLNFMQNGLPAPGSNTGAQNLQSHPISRVGMSYDQAEQLLQTLQRALLHKKYLSGPKRLPPTVE